MNEVTITGSRGFIGTNLREKLKIPYREIDLSLGIDHTILKGSTGTLIYLSAWAKENESFSDPAKYIDNNIRDLSTILTNNDFSRIIFPSSSSVYDKDGNLGPISVYGITKLAGENLLKIYAKEAWILRIANPYGRYDRRSALYHLEQCKKNKKVFTIYNDPEVVKDFFPVEHICNIIIKILNSEIESGTYNVGSGNATKVLSLLTSVCTKLGIPYEYVNPPKGISSGYICTKNLLSSGDINVEEEWLKYLL